MAKSQISLKGDGQCHENGTSHGDVGERVQEVGEQVIVDFGMGAESPVNT